MKRLLTIMFLAFAGCDNMVTLSRYQEELHTIEKIGVMAHLDITWPKSTGPLKRALAYYRDVGVSTVVILGDPTKDGYKNQREVFDAAWNEVFRSGTAPKLVISKEPYLIGGVVFSGEAKLPLTSQMCVYPLTGNRIYVGSMHGFLVSGEMAARSGSSLGEVRNSAQGLLVHVLDYPDEELRVKRLDFSGKTPEEVGSPWMVDRNGVIGYSVPSEARAPEFWADTQITVVRGYDKAGNGQYTVIWPSVLAKFTGSRAFSYEVRVGERVIRRVQSNGFFLPEDRDLDAVSCVVKEDELNGAAPRFGVTPVSSLGEPGKTVWSK